jgi:hypothetical protein
MTAGVVVIFSLPYDFNVRTTKKRVEKLRYMHRNPVKRHLSLASSCCALCKSQSVYTSINAELGLADSARPFCCFTQHGPQFRSSVQRLNRLSRAGYKVLSITKNGGRCNVNWAGRPRCSLDAVAEGSTKALAWPRRNTLTHIIEDGGWPGLQTAEATTAAGAPSFAQFAKGGYHERMRVPALCKLRKGRGTLQ